MKLADFEAKEKFQHRLRRIEGQVRGVQVMVAEERDCRDILQQLAAIRAAVQGASLAFIEEYASRCLLGSAAEEPGQREQLLKDLMVLLSKAP
jgi:DNA-binding FrmR family transcriptional regulator